MSIPTETSSVLMRAHPHAGAGFLFCWQCLVARVSVAQGQGVSTLKRQLSLLDEDAIANVEESAH